MTDLEKHNLDRALLLGAFSYHYVAAHRTPAEDMSVALDVFEESGGDAFLEYLGLDDSDLPDLDERSEDWAPSHWIDAEALDEDGWSRPHYNQIHRGLPKFPVGTIWVPLYEIENTNSSDYTGDTHSRSNYRVIENMAEDDPFVALFLVFSYGPQGYSTVLLRLDRGPLPEALTDVVSVLENGSILDEGDLEDLETGDAQDAWANYGQNDWAIELHRTFPDNTDEIEEMGDDELWDLYHEASEEGGISPAHNSEGVEFYLRRAVEYVPEDTWDD